MNQIDHDPSEPKIDRDRSPFARPWPAVFVFLCLMWVGAFYLGLIDWQSVGLGFLTAVLLTSWFYDWHGTDAPKSWQRPPGDR